MDIFKEDKIIFAGGGLKSAFKWSILIFLITTILQIIAGLLTIDNNELFGLLFLTILPIVLLFLVFYISLKKGISSLGLTTYSLRLEFLGIMILFTLILSFISTLILTSEFRLPSFGIFPVIMLFLVAYFVKE